MARARSALMIVLRALRVRSLALAAAALTAAVVASSVGHATPEPDVVAEPPPCAGSGTTGPVGPEEQELSDAPQQTFPEQPTTASGEDPLDSMPAQDETAPGVKYPSLAGLPWQPEPNPVVPTAPVTRAAALTNKKGQRFKVYVSAGRARTANRLIAKLAGAVESFPIKKRIPSAVEAVPFDRLLLASTGKSLEALAAARQRLHGGTLRKVLARLHVNADRVLQTTARKARAALLRKVSAGQLRRKAVDALDVPALLRKLMNEPGAPFLFNPADLPRRPADVGRWLKTHPDSAAINVQPLSPLKAKSNVVWFAFDPPIGKGHHHLYIQTATESWVRILAEKGTQSVNFRRSSYPPARGQENVATGGYSPWAKDKTTGGPIRYLSVVTGHTRGGTYTISGFERRPWKRKKLPRRSEATRLKVGLVTDIGGLNDKGFNACAYAGLQQAQKQLGVSGRVLISKGPNDYIPNFTTLVKQKYDLIIGVGFLQTDAMDTIATKFPSQKFAIVDVDVTGMKHKPKNVQGILFKEQEVGYIAGVVATLLSRDSRQPRRAGSAPFIASVGGIKIPPVDRFIAGYGYAAKKTVPASTVKHSYSQDFVDQAKCRELATNFFDQGADVVFQVAGGCGLGVIAAAKEEGKWAIGVDVDQNHVAPLNVATSALKRVDQGVFLTIQSLVKGTFKGGVNRSFGVKEGGVDTGNFARGVPADIRAAAVRAAADIKAGKIKDIPTTVAG